MASVATSTRWANESSCAEIDGSTAPPWVRRAMPWRSSSARSRRAVIGETPKRDSTSVTVTAPASRSRSAMAERRAMASIGRSERLRLISSSFVIVTMCRERVTGCGSRCSSRVSTTRCSRRPGGRWSTLLERLGCEVEFPLEQTCCGQMHVNSGYEHEAAGLLERFAARVRGLRRGRLAVGVVCRARARAHPVGARSRVRVDRVPGRPAGRGRCRRVVPASGDAASDVPLAAAAGDRRPAAAAAGGGARDRSRRARRRARVLRVRRDVRGQERRHVDGDALRQGAARARHARGGVHVGGHVVPDAHRRRAVARSAPACATMHLAEILAAQE